MIDYEVLELAVVERMASLASVCDILPLPENQDGLKVPVTKPRMIVSYHSSVYKGKTTSDGVAMDERVFVQVEVSGKKLRGPSGLYAMMNGCRGLLLGRYLGYRKYTDVVEVADVASLPDPGVVETVYVALDSAKEYEYKDGKYRILPLVKFGTAIAFKEAGFSMPNFENGIWTYILVMYLDTVAVQLDEEEELQLIERITVEGTFDGVTVDETFEVPE